MKKLTLLLVLIVASVLIVATTGAQDNGEVVTINQIDDSAFPQLTLFANVQDEFGVPVPDLGADDFSVVLNDSTASIVSVENVRNDNLPISIVLVVDTSSSIFGEPLDDTKTAALAFLDNLLPNDEVAIIAFNQSVRTEQEFTTDTDALRNAINNLESGGQTALYDATLAASELAAQANNPRRFVVFLTDGNEFGGSIANPTDAIEVANANNVSFYTIALGFDAQPAYLEQLAEETRGQSFFYPSSNTLSELYAFLAEYLRTQYVITVDTSIEPDGVESDLSVTVDGLTDTTAYTPPDLYPQLALPAVPEATVAESTDFTFGVSAERGLSSVSITLNGETLDIDPVAEGATDYEQTVTFDPLSVAAGVPSVLEVTASDNAGGNRSASINIDVVSFADNSEWTPSITEFDGVSMALVPRGCFMMGSDGSADEQPVSEVCIESSFWVDVTPVTNAQFGSTGLFDGDTNPRDRVSWAEAQAFCESRGAQLPTEAQWEYVARGSSSLIYPWGDIPSLDLAANDGNSEGTTAPVGSFSEGDSWVGASDMAGNVWEWTSSAYQPYPYDATDGREDSDDTALRVLRGGAATNTVDLIYSANRLPALPDSSFGVVGFRCVMPYSSN